MASKTLYSDRYGSLSIDLRKSGNLLITASDEFTSIYLYIPTDEIKKVVEQITEIATAPEWTLAKFVRVKPAGYPSYTMVSAGDGEWRSEHGTTHYTESFLRMADEIDFEVIA